MKNRIYVAFIMVISMWISGCGKEAEEIWDDLKLKEDPGAYELQEITAEEASSGSAGQSVNAAEEKRLVADEQSSTGGVTEDAGAEAVQAENDTESANIFVHVCGAVNHPAVYEVKSDSRVYELIEKAGGFTEGADTDYLNLAEKVEDGARIQVPTQKQVQEAQKEELVLRRDGTKITQEQAKAEAENARKDNQSQETPDGLVNINTADVATLCTLSGVGQSRAETIIAYREEHGSFRNIEDIMQVTGIKEGLYNKIKDKIKVQ